MEQFLEPLWTDRNIWVPFVAAIVGGLLSLLGSLSAIYLAGKIDRKKREEESELGGAEQAYATMFILLDGHNSIANLQRQINEMFDDADQAGTGDLAPWAKVRPLVGASDNLQEIDPRETSFLIEEKKADLINEVHLIQRRMKNILASSESYNRLRLEFQALLETKMIDSQLEGGTVVAAAFEGKDKRIAEYREAQLNNLLGQIMDMLEKDVAKSWKIISDFKAAAEQRYDSHFPKFNLDKAEYK